MSLDEIKLIRRKFAQLPRLKTSEVIVRMKKRERGGDRGLLSGPPGEPEPENQRNQKQGKKN